MKTIAFGIFCFIFFTRVKQYLWQEISTKSYIRKTVGVQALFDVMRIVASRDYQDDETLKLQLDKVLKNAQEIDFQDNFFQASGKGRVRIKNCILLASKLADLGDLPDADRRDYRRVVENS